MSGFTRRLQRVHTVRPTDGLPFAMDYTALGLSSKKVFAHYFGPYPRSLNDSMTLATDSYTTAFNNPYYATYQDYGGMYRDRPIWRPQRGGDYTYLDAVWDIDQARAVGIDGFFCDLLGLSGANYDRYMKLVQAADDMSVGFYVLPMVDANGATGAADPITAADHIRKYSGKNGSYYLPDGRYVVGSFLTEGKTYTWWQQVFAELQTTWGLDVAFFSVYLNWNQAPNYAGLCYVSSVWGYGADPGVINAAGDYKSAATGRGEKFMAPIVSQDIRPPARVWDEALNTGSLRAAWEKAITQDADYAQMVTWSDFSETPMAPSASNGWVNLDVSSYYISKWKTGQYPSILRDCIYLSHRPQTLDATITGPTTLPMSQWVRGSRSTARNYVEALTFLTAPADITITSGGSTYTYTAPAGMNSAAYPAQLGVQSAVAVRNSQTVANILSPVNQRSSDISQDTGYYRFSSLRGTTGQFDVLSQYR